MPVCALKDGTSMPYADLGAGAPILLVHGLGAHGGFFEELGARLARTHRVLVPTLRAHPGSAQGSAPLTIETLADDIADLIETLGLTSVTALGWSMGAMALWSAAPALGARLNAIIVEDMAPRLVNDAAWEHGLAGGYGESDTAATVNEITSDWPAYVARIAPRLFAPGARGDLIDWVAREMTAADPRAMALFWASMAAKDYREALARIEQPMLVIRGAESQLYPDGATAFIARNARNATRIVIPGAGHVTHLEAPDAFFNHVEAFVRTTRRPELRSGGAIP